MRKNNNILGINNLGQRNIKLNISCHKECDHSNKTCLRGQQVTIVIPEDIRLIFSTCHAFNVPTTHFLNTGADNYFFAYDIVQLIETLVHVLHISHLI